ADGGGGALVWVGIFGFGVAPVLLTLLIAYLRHRYVRKVHRKHAEQLEAAQLADVTDVADSTDSEESVGETRAAAKTNAGAKKGETFELPKVPRLSRAVPALTVTALVVGGAVAFASSVHVTEYIRAANSDYTMDQYYKDPVVTDSSEKRNMVLIYLESGEETLTDTDLFEKNAFEPLENVTREEDGWSSVQDLHQYEGGGWTMAGITGTQCGVPLKGNGLLSGKSGFNAIGEVDNYFGGLTCTGDILKEEGYKNVFMGGAQGSFASKDIFLQSHGYDELYDLDYWREQGEPADQFRDDWGLSDKRLMANAKDKVDELHTESEQTGQPFNLSMLTVDTHEPVHLYDYCEPDTEEEVTSMFECSMTQVADFVNYMKSQGYMEDTSVMIMGDHVKHMGASNAFHEQLDDHPNRTIFNRFWVPGEDPRTTSMRSGVDQTNMMPTILDAAGIRLRDSEAGLGVSAFEPEVPEGSAQALPEDAYQDLMKSRSAEFYEQAWEGQDLEKSGN
ncbi:MAG TPA: sulfatase-like hydrolase/transferase, partial [Candidatus Corynebacterium avicola]|nr:sulfatase-like hydrolase/transferase [Candidatus Corynebacterium avicola]